MYPIPNVKNLVNVNLDSTKLALPTLIALLIVTLLGILAYTISTLYEQKLDGIIIDLAGRQRMLIQRHLNEILLRSQGIPTDFETTRHLLRRSAEALLHGGHIIVNLDEEESVSIPPAPTKTIANLLSRQQTMIRELIRKSDEFLDVGSDHVVASSMLKDLRNLSAEIQGVANLTVKQFSKSSQSKVQSMIIVELLIGLITAIIGTFLGRQIKKTNVKLTDEIQERTRIEETLRYRIRIEHLVTDLSTQFITLEIKNLDAEIYRALAAIGQFAGLDRCFLFSIDLQRQVARSTHVWCRSGVPEPRMFSNEYSLAEWSWFARQLMAHRLVQIIGLDGLPSEAIRERLEFQRQAIQSLVVVPLVWQGSLVGYLRFDAVQRQISWSPEDIRLLQMSGEILVNALQRKCTEEELRTREQEKLNAYRQRDAFQSALLSLVSHELRTPLTAIKASVAGLKELGPRVQVDLWEEALDGIHVEIDYLNGLIENLLDMSRVEAGTLSTQREWHLLEDLVEGAVRRVKRLLYSRHLSVNFDKEIPPICVDGGDLQRVFVNLLDNAVKYSLSSSRITIGARVNHGHLEIRITNDCGLISVDDISRIFERFYRIKQANTALIRGTGLGLSICKGIIEAHGGRIWADISTPMEFSIICMLPLHTAASEICPQHALETEL